MSDVNWKCCVCGRTFAFGEERLMLDTYGERKAYCSWKCVRTNGISSIVGLNAKWEKEL